MRGSINLKIAFLFLCGLALCLIIFFGLSFFILKTHLSSQCQALVNIANDAKKISYLEQWVKSRENDQDFQDFIKHQRYLSSTHSPLLFEKIDLNWDYLGISRDHAAIAFRNMESLDGTDIRSISFIEMRETGLVMIIDDEKKLKLSPDEKRHQVLTGRKGYYVNCE